MVENRVLLVSMPWRLPFRSCLALATLRPIAERAGIKVDNLYGTLLLPGPYEKFNDVDYVATYLFLPYLYPDLDIDQMLDRALKRFADEFVNSDMRRWALNAHKLERQMLRESIRSAGVCLDRCLARAAKPCYDVVGFSLTFENQVAASLSLARRLKKRNPSVKIMFGGAAFLGEQADGLVSSFPEVDAACHAEGDQVIVPLIRALRGEISLAQVPGIAYRDGESRVRHNPPPLMRQNLDELPIPEYEDFVAQLDQSDWRGSPYWILFETSRGCWWGQKKPCRFCGFNSLGRAFRTKSPERAYDELSLLYHKYPNAEMFMATDNSLSLGYLKTLFPRLARMKRLPNRPFRMFFEIRPNLTRSQVDLLVKAGISALQIGIESFDDEILKHMNKGSTALKNVQVLKWIAPKMIQAIYNIILRTPGEKAGSYERMLDLLPFIKHLPPPNTIIKMSLMRFSTYFNHPEAFGITNIRPENYYEDLYRQPGSDLKRLAYLFDYDFPADPEKKELEKLHQQLVRGYIDWVSGWQPNQVGYLDCRHFAVIIDHRPEAHLQMEVILGRALEVFRFIDQSRSRTEIEEQFASLEPTFLDAMSRVWRHRRWAYRDARDIHLSVLSELDRAYVWTAFGKPKAGSSGKSTQPRQRR